MKKLKITHITHYRLEEAAARATQYLRLTPRRDRCQQVLAWSITGPELLTPWTDGFGNICHIACERDAHESLEVIVEGMVQIEDTAGVMSLDDGLPPAMFLRPTPLTESSEKLEALVEPFNGVLQADGELQVLHGLMAAIAERVPYKGGETHVDWTAAEALEHGYGVCQDHAHLFIAACRLLNIPARYVSGYLAAGQGAAASHAWAEAYVPNLGWVSFDPTNKQSATDDYVRLAVGFDYASVPPIVGLRHGGWGETMDVSIQIQSMQ